VTQVIQTLLPHYNRLFQDPSVQFYGGPLFKYIQRHNIRFPDFFCLLRNRRSIVDAADTAFCTLPAPQGRVLPPRSQPVYSSSSSSSYSAPSAAAPPPAVDMSRFMDRYGGCFAPQVKMMRAVLVVVETD
jgi:hypothetical protein